MHPDRLRDARDQLNRDPRDTIRILTDRNAGQPGADPEASYLLGVAFFRLNDFGSAEGQFRNSIALDPSKAEVFYYLGLTHERRGNPAEGVKAYQVAAALNPNFEQAQEKLRQLGASTRPANPPARPRPIESELTLPSEDEEFADYERRRRRKAVIDASAEYHAQMAGLPAAWKVALVIGALVIVGFFGFAIYQGMTESDVERQAREAQEQVCAQAREQGVDLPGC